MAKLASQANSCYNKLMKIVAPAVLATPQGRTHSRKECIMDIIPPHDLFQHALSFTDSPQKVKCCSKCGEVKPFSAFHKRNNRKSGAYSRCKQCVAAPKEKRCLYCHEVKPLSNFVRSNGNVDENTCVQCLLTLIEEKECSRCHQIKPLSDFVKSKAKRMGLVSRCKQCLSETHPHRPYVPGKYPTPTPEVARSKNLFRLYGITLVEYDAMLALQGGVCKVCGGPPYGKGGRYHVDHDHVTGKIRGILCHKCNVALGMVQDKVEHLKALIAYLGEPI